MYVLEFECIFHGRGPSRDNRLENGIQTGGLSRQVVDLLDVSLRCSGLQEGGRRRGLEFVEGTHDLAGLRGTVVVGVDDIAAERVILMAPAAVHVAVALGRAGVADEGDAAGLGIVAAAAAGVAARRDADFGAEGSVDAMQTSPGLTRSRLAGIAPK